jgi:hypothetical protein
MLAGSEYFRVSAATSVSRVGVAGCPAAAAPFEGRAAVKVLSPVHRTAIRRSSAMSRVLSYSASRMAAMSSQNEPAKQKARRSVYSTGSSLRGRSLSKASSHRRFPRRSKREFDVRCLGFLGMSRIEILTSSPP